eukprot:m.258741 g.258741  ORF g.258741 m.258741 type:complete len:647 (-) comp21785_c0_seq1:133-2073(-)
MRAGVLALLLCTAAAIRVPLERKTLPHTIPRWRRVPVALTGLPWTAYTLTMSIGTPGQDLSFLVDTGSATTAVAATAGSGATKFYDRTASSTFVADGEALSLTYMSGSWVGVRMSDVLTLRGTGLVAVRAEFAGITQSSQFFLTGQFPFQGILGLAYVSLARPAGHPLLPIFDVIKAANPGLPDAFGIQLCDPRVVASGNTLQLIDTPSVIDLGASETSLASLTTSSFVYTPIAQELYYGIEVLRVAVGGKPLAVDCSVFNSPRYAIVDSGTTGLFLPIAAYNELIATLKARLAFQSATERSAFFSGTCVPMQRSFIAAAPNITVTLTAAGGTEMDLLIDPWRYMIAVPISSFTGSSTDVECRALGVYPTTCSDSVGTILGIVAMSGYTVLFDRTNHRIGWAPSSCADSSGYSRIGPIPRRARSAACPPKYCITETSTDVLSLGAYIGIMVGGTVLIVIILVIIALQRPRDADSAMPLRKGKPELKPPVYLPVLPPALSAAPTVDSRSPPARSRPPYLPATATTTTPTVPARLTLSPPTRRAAPSVAPPARTAFSPPMRRAAAPAAGPNMPAQGRASRPRATSPAVYAQATSAQVRHYHPVPGRQVPHYLPPSAYHPHPPSPFPKRPDSRTSVSTLTLSESRVVLM